MDFRYLANYLLSYVLSLRLRLFSSSSVTSNISHTSCLLYGSLWRLSLTSWIISLKVRPKFECKSPRRLYFFQSSPLVFAITWRTNICCLHNRTDRLSPKYDQQMCDNEQDLYLSCKSTLCNSSVVMTCWGFVKFSKTVADNKYSPFGKPHISWPHGVEFYKFCLKHEMLIILVTSESIAIQKNYNADLEGCDNF